VHVIALRRRQRSGRGEDGFAMVVAVFVLFICGLLVGAVLIATSEEETLAHTYSGQQRAYFAALAGIDAYKYQLAANPTYWLKCPATAAPVTVTGASEETYSYKTLPSTSWVAKGHVACESEKQLSIVETADSASGTFRVESTGYVSGCRGNQTSCSRRIVASFTHPGYLNYVYLSNFEEADPETVGKSAEECEYYHEEREQRKIQKGIECVSFPWIAGDKIEGPFHTNDKAQMSGSPVFGRAKHEPADHLEFDRGYESGTPKFEGEYSEGGATLLPPEAPAEELLSEAGSKFTGRTIITLEGSKMKVVAEGKTKENVPLPTNGVIAVVNSSEGCPVKYKALETKYNTEDAKCGNVYIKGKYSSSLTVVAQNDIVIVGNLTTEGGESGGAPTGAATLGLIALQHARLYHPVKEPCGFFCSPPTESSCQSENATAGEKSTEEFGLPLKSPIIDAAILSTKHSWGVDNFSCGRELGEITVWGSIAENFRGRVTCCFSGGDYTKNYKYDERFLNDAPPSFLAPSTTGGWKVARETAPP
jgi:hypothetical protein